MLQAALLAALVAAAAHGSTSTSAPASATDLCYEVQWDLANPNGPQRHIIQPVTAFPPQHAMVNRDICGVARSAGDPIPANGLWSKKGRNTPGGDCNNLSSGDLFYACA